MRRSSTLLDVSVFSELLTRPERLGSLEGVGAARGDPTPTDSSVKLAAISSSGKPGEWIVFTRTAPETSTSSPGPETVPLKGTVTMLIALSPTMVPSSWAAGAAARVW